MTFYHVVLMSAISRLCAPGILGTSTLSLVCDARPGSTTHHPAHSLLVVQLLGLHQCVGHRLLHNPCCSLGQMVWPACLWGYCHVDALSQNNFASLSACLKGPAPNRPFSGSGMLATSTHTHSKLLVYISCLLRCVRRNTRRWSSPGALASVDQWACGNSQTRRSIHSVCGDTCQDEEHPLKVDIKLGDDVLFPWLAMASQQCSALGQ